MQFIDTHCHVHFQAYQKDMSEVVQRSLDAGVGMITVGTQSSTSKKAIELAEKYDGVWATVGLHPNHLHKQEFFDDEELPPENQEVGKIKTRSEKFDPKFYRELANHPKVVAIGEFGLDYYRIPPNVDRQQMIEDQKQSCHEQLKFANEIDKPIIIHCRDAHDDQFELLKAEIDNGGLKKKGVIHCFTGTTEDAKRYESIYFRLGINGILMFSKELQEVVKNIPLAQILIETDAPYLAPPPHRGKRNEPAYVKFIAEKIAEIKGIPTSQVAAATTINAKRLFQI